MKAKVAKFIASRVKDGDILGLGSGSTVELAVEAIGARIGKEGISVSGVPTSKRIGEFASACGITVLSPAHPPELSWAFDGADEVDPNLDMIKGAGGAMLSEKIIAKHAGGIVVVITEEKLVAALGSNFAVPVEVIPDAVTFTSKALRSLGASETTLRVATGKYGPVITDHGNVIIDARFAKINKDLEGAINQITGVVENGLFFDLANEVLVAKQDGIYSLKKRAENTVEERIS